MINAEIAVHGGGAIMHLRLGPKFMTVYGFDAHCLTREGHKQY